MNRTSVSALEENGLLARWARLAVRRRRWVLVSWLVALAMVIVLWRSFGGEFSASFDIPGSESQRAFDLLKERFPQQAGDTAVLVFESRDGVVSQTARQRVEQVLERARGLPGVAAVSSPFEPGRGGVSGDGRIGYATIQYGEQAMSVPRSHVEALFALADSATGDGLRLEVGGRVAQAAERQVPGASEAIGLVAAMVILLIAFGSVVAMGLPLATALLGLAASFALIGLAANFLELPNGATSLASMIGIGVGIDYALFVVTRFREELRAGQGVEDAVARAMTTAGRSVAFAGMVVAIALGGLAAIGTAADSSLAVAMAIVVALAVLTALTVLPALLGITGHRIDRWAFPLWRGTGNGERTTVWYRLALMIQRRPVVWLVTSLALLLLLATPLLSMRLGSSDAGNASPSQHSRRAYDLLAQAFGPGFNGPLTIVVDLADAEPRERQTYLREMTTSLAASAGVAWVLPPTMNRSGDTAVLTVLSEAAPQDAATQDLVHRLRNQLLPAVGADSEAHAYVTGPTAAFIDVADRISSRMPYFFAAVLGLSFLLLTLVFRSLLVPLKAALVNLLSIGAAYGVLVAVFQWGWLAGAIGVKPGPIESFLPMLLFAILFGLSMDYEVFLISRIREAYLRTGDNSESVAHGLAVTARVITAAATVMVAVFLSFVLGPDRLVKEAGLGLAAAILIDATVVRLVLVPAAMQLMGDANWWLPRLLGRLLSRLAMETADH
ncbi:MAG: MMPL family transporter [Chloroflexi bacterium]|nr:MMPL family transporter [Chloroflexota bacterium]